MGSNRSVLKLLVLDRNTLYHITLCQQMIIDKVQFKKKDAMKHC